MRGFGKYLLWVYSGMALVFLLIPVIYTIVFSFNDARRTNIIWRGFTFDNWLNVCDAQDVCPAFMNSIIVAGVSTVLATAMGTAIAIALVRYRFKFRQATTLLLFLPMANKLKQRVEQKMLYHEMLAEGVIAISQGESPINIELKLEAYRVERPILQAH